MIKYCHPNQQNDRKSYIIKIYFQHGIHLDVSINGDFCFRTSFSLHYKKKKMLTKGRIIMLHLLNPFYAIFRDIYLEYQHILHLNIYSVSSAEIRKMQKIIVPGSYINKKFLSNLLLMLHLQPS